MPTQPSTEGPITIPATISSTGEGTRSAGSALTTSGAMSATTMMISRLVKCIGPPHLGGQVREGVEHSEVVRGSPWAGHEVHPGCGSGNRTLRRRPIRSYSRSAGRRYIRSAYVHPTHLPAQRAHYE